jgi:hypothetical protein
MFVRGAAIAVALVGILAVIVRPSTGAGPERVYVVRPYDTLWSIVSRTYAGDPRQGVWELERRNRLRSALLRPGQRLVLP